MSTPTTIFLTSATGSIGQKLVPMLLKSIPSCKLVLPSSRDSSSVMSTLKLSQEDSGRVTVAQGSVTDPQWVEQLWISHAVTAVFLNLTGTDELFTTMNLLNTLQHHLQVRQLVYLSIWGRPNDPAQSWKAGHFTVKVIVEQYLRALRTEKETFKWTVLGPTLFFSNDERAKDSLFRSGVFPEPFGPKGCSRVDLEDIAAIATTVFQNPETYHGRKIAIGSRKWYTSDDTARIWSEAMGKDIKVVDHNEQGMDAAEEFFKSEKKLGPAWGRDLKMMLESFRDFGFGMTDEEYQDQIKILGREPASYESHVKDMVAKWKGERKAA